MKIKNITTLGDLKKNGYKSRSIKEEMRENLIRKLKSGEKLFEEIQGYEDTVIPQLQTAVLSKHNIILLGLRGQAKTKIARLMTQLLDEYMPIVSGSELNDDPLNPLSRYAINIIEDEGDTTPITWIHRNDRYTEKLATPDVSVADLIGDIDPIKAAAQKLNYSDERVIHYGLVARSNRNIFVINELPDLQPRIQVALFNILQEGDIQIRGFKLRLPLDIQFVFTANPEDYTNRGSIITPLKDRIGSQILTHYPKNIEIAGAITLQESKIEKSQSENIFIAPLLHQLIEQTAMEARQSELVDQKSGVSARLTISALENLYSTCEQRMLLNHENKSNGRISDLQGIIPSITGRVELVYEGEAEGIQSVALTLMDKAIRKVFAETFTDPEKLKKSKNTNPYSEIINWFEQGNTLSLLHLDTTAQYIKKLDEVHGLKKTVKQFLKNINENEVHLWMEFLLYGLAAFSQISKTALERNTEFKDLIRTVFNFKSMDDEV